MDKKLILIADDDAEIIASMSHILVSAGYNIIAAKNGKEALSYIYERKPDVIILDITMPEMNGFDVLKHLRENPLPDKWQPVIIVSGRDDFASLKKGYEYEAERRKVRYKRHRKGLRGK